MASGSPKNNGLIVACTGPMYGWMDARTQEWMVRGGQVAGCLYTVGGVGEPWMEPSVPECTLVMKAGRTAAAGWMPPAVIYCRG